MMHSGMYYFPVGAPVLLGFLILFGLLVVVASRLLRFPSASMGLAPQTMFTVLLLSLLGSYINIPIAHWHERYISAPAQITYFGIPYVIPLVRAQPGLGIAEPIASIGGAGTFDGIFVISLLAVVYAGVFARPARG